MPPIPPPPALWLGGRCNPWERAGHLLSRNLLFHKLGCQGRPSADPEAPRSFCETRGVTPTEQRANCIFSQTGQMWGILEHRPHSVWDAPHFVLTPQKSCPPGAVSLLASFSQAHLPLVPHEEQGGGGGEVRGLDSEGQKSAGWSCWLPGALDLCLA